MLIFVSHKLAKQSLYCLVLTQLVSYLFCIIKYSGVPLMLLTVLRFSRTLVNVMGNALLMKFSNDVENYEIEVTKIGQNNPIILTVTVLLLMRTWGN